MAARRSSGSVAKPNSSTITSNVQVSPRWLQNTPSTSKGVAAYRSATPSTSAGATNRNTARGSMKRRISHGQAMRSTLGRARVTQTVRAWWSSGGIFAVATKGRLALRQASKPPSSVSAGTPVWRNQAAAPSLSLAPFWQITMAEWLANSPVHADGSVWGRRVELGMRLGFAL
jgi:hypothetical protein